MYKMQIKMNEEKILREDKINLKKMYAWMNGEFAKLPFIKEETTDGSLMYRTTSPDTEFTDVGVIYAIFSGQEWFVPNCSFWYLFTDHHGQSKEFEREDFLETIRKHS